MSGSRSLAEALAAPAALGRHLDRGGVLAIPTESSYGFAADPLDAAGVAAIFRLKRRPPGQPLPVVAAGLDQLARLGVELGPAAPLARAWPGPLSILAPCAAGVPAAAGSGRLAVRVPGHRGLRRLLAALDRPLTATSANRSGALPVLDPGELERLFPEPELEIVAAGVLAGGAPSTIVAVEDGRAVVMRAGAVARQRLAALAPGLAWDAAPPGAGAGPRDPVGQSGR